MRAIFLVSFSAILVVLLGFGGLTALGRHPQLTPAAAALGTALVTAILAGTPLALVGRKSQIAVMQAGLLATVVHMALLATAAGIAVLGHAPVGGSFLYWLGILYATTLIALVGCIIGAFKQTDLAK